MNPHTGWKPCPQPISTEFANIVTRATTDMPAIAASPNTPADWFSATVATDASPWRHSDGKPPRRISRKSDGCGRKLRALSRRLLPDAHIFSRMQKETNWLMTVAAAAPAIPIWNVKIKSGSSAMFSTAPVTMPTIA